MWFYLGFVGFYLIFYELYSFVIKIKCSKKNIPFFFICGFYNTCMYSKPQRHHPYGLLKQLLILELLLSLFNMLLTFLHSVNNSIKTQIQLRKKLELFEIFIYIISYYSFLTFKFYSDFSWFYFVKYFNFVLLFFFLLPFTALYCLTTSWAGLLGQWHRHWWEKDRKQIK